MVSGSETKQRWDLQKGLSDTAPRIKTVPTNSMTCLRGAPVVTFSRVPN